MKSRRLILAVGLAVGVIFSGCQSSPGEKGQDREKLAKIKALSQERKDSLLVQAAQAGYLDDAVLLLAAGADPNSQGQEKRLPLYEAVLDGNTIMMALLIEHGADVNKSSWGSTPLDVAAWSGKSNPLIYDLLVDHGADLNRKGRDDMSPLHRAAARGDTALVGHLVEKGADINLAGGEKTAILWAASRGKQETVELLIELGADPQATNRQGMNALHFAAQSKNPGLVEFLLGRGLAVDGKTKNGSTPLDFAAQALDLETIKLLHQRGAGIEDLCAPGKKALHRAARYGKDDIVRYLVANGVEVNCRDKSGLTALHYAVEHCNLNTVNLLIELGANVNARSSEGQTPLARLDRENTYWCHDPIRKALVEQGAKAK